MAIGCVGLLANQMIVYDELVKIVIFDIIAMIMYQIPHALMVLQIHVRFFLYKGALRKKFDHGGVAGSGLDSHPGLGSNNLPKSANRESKGGVSGTAANTEKVVEGVANEKIQCCYLKPGVFSRWSQKTFQYDPVLQLISLIDKPTQEYAGLKMPVAFNLADRDNTRLVEISRQETTSTPPASFAYWSPE